MDSNHRFSSVDEALHILPAASDMKSNTKECMQYINSLSLSEEQEDNLEAMLPSLQKDILPELAARLHLTESVKPECGNVERLQRSLQEMVSAISNDSKNWAHCEKVEKDIIDYFEVAYASSDSIMTDACKSVLFKEFKAIVQLIERNESKYRKQNYSSENAWAALQWVIRIIQKCNGYLYETVIIFFCEVNRLLLSVRHSNVSSNVKLEILMNLLKSLSSGKIVTATSVRVTFLTKWADTMVLVHKWVFPEHLKLQERLRELQSAMISVAESLPFAEQRRVYVVWKNVFIAYSLTPIIVLDWWADKIKKAMIKGIFKKPSNDPPKHSSLVAKIGCVKSWIHVVFNRYGLVAAMFLMVVALRVVFEEYDIDIHININRKSTKFLPML